MGIGDSPSARVSLNGLQNFKGRLVITIMIVQARCSAPWVPPGFDVLGRW